MYKQVIVAIVAAIVVVAVVVLGSLGWLGKGLGGPVSALSVSPARTMQEIGVPPGGSSSLQRSGIVVTGQATVTVQPDIAKVTLGVEVTNTTANGAQQDAANKMDAVTAQLRQQGIDDKDIQTARFDLSPEYDYSTRSPVLKGYKVTNLVVVTIRDLSKVGGALDAVVATGATRIQGISFSVSDPAAAGAQGRDAAMKNAKAKADQLAGAAGVSVGAPIAIEEVTSAPPTPVIMAPQAAAAGAQAQTPISPGTQEIQTVVRVNYAIK